MATPTIRDGRDGHPDDRSAPLAAFNTPAGPDPVGGFMSMNVRGQRASVHLKSLRVQS